MTGKPLVFVRSSRRDLRGFPARARREIGHDLFLVQLGVEPRDWRPMPSIGVGVREIRVHTEGEWRVIYIATRPEAVFVLHAFAKRTRRTRPLDLAVARARLAALRRPR